MGSCSPLGEEGLGAPFLSSHPPPLVRAPLVPASIYSTTTSKPPIHLPPSTSSTVPVSLCTSCCASSHLPACPTLLSAFSTLHPQPCSRPILPLGPPLGSTTTQCTVETLEQMSSARYRSKSASAGDPRLEQTRLLFGSESELLVAARRCLYRVGMQHATLSSTHNIQRDEHMETGSNGWERRKFHKQSISTRQ